MKKLKKQKESIKILFKTRHKEYADVLLNTKRIRHKMKRIESKLHKIASYENCKFFLSYFDHKRHILDVGINSLA